MRQTVMGIPLFEVLRAIWTRKMWVKRTDGSGGWYEDDIPKPKPSKRLLAYRVRRKRLNKIATTSRNMNRGR